MQIRKDIPSKMYHYTSLESLCSIVENQEFWLGDTRQMNDYNEALERLNILNSLLNEDADLRDDPPMSRCHSFDKQKHTTKDAYLCCLFY